MPGSLFRDATQKGRRSRGSEARARIVRDYELGIIAARYEALYTDIAARDAASPIPPRAGAFGGGHRPTARPG
jgi:hypothetical protein